MDDVVVDFTGLTDLDIDPEKVLNGAKEAGLQNLIIVGEDSEGLLYVASSLGDLPKVYFLLELAKKQLLDFSE